MIKCRKLIKKVEKTCTVRRAAEDELAALDRLTDGRLPKQMRDFFSQYNIDGSGWAQIDGFIYVCGIEGFIRQNELPLYRSLLGMGFLCIAGLANYDRICVDLLSERGSVRQCPTALTKDPDGMYVPGGSGGFKRLPLTRENLLKVSPILAETFFDYIKSLRDGTLPTYTLEKIYELYEQNFVSV